MTPKPTQQSRILAVLESLTNGTHTIPEEYLRRHPSGDGVSARYFKQVLFISECNARMSEMNTNHKKLYGVELIETSKAKDDYGFVFHRLKPMVMEQTQEEWFARLPASANV